MTREQKIKEAMEQSVELAYDGKYTEIKQLIEDAYNNVDDTPTIEIFYQFDNETPVSIGNTNDVSPNMFGFELSLLEGVDITFTSEAGHTFRVFITKKDM